MSRLAALASALTEEIRTRSAPVPGRRYFNPTPTTGSRTTTSGLCGDGGPEGVSVRPRRRAGSVGTRHRPSTPPRAVRVGSYDTPHVCRPPPSRPASKGSPTPRTGPLHPSPLHPSRRDRGYTPSSPRPRVRTNPCFRYPVPRILHRTRVKVPRPEEKRAKGFIPQGSRDPLTSLPTPPGPFPDTPVQRRPTENHHFHVSHLTPRETRGCFFPAGTTRTSL